MRKRLVFVVILSVFSNSVFADQKDWESPGCREIVEIPDFSGTFAFYTVRVGDTVSRIVALMRKCGVNEHLSMEPIRMSGKVALVESLYAGQKICIPFD